MPKTALRKINKQKAVKKSAGKKVNPKTVNKDLTAKHFIDRLQKLQSKKELKIIQRYFKSGEGEYGDGDHFMGIQMGKVFALAKEFMLMSLDEVEKLLENSIHEVRAGAVSIMDFQARDKRTSDAQKKELFD